jgi:hypothetical protein
VGKFGKATHLVVSGYLSAEAKLIIQPRLKMGETKIPLSHILSRCRRNFTVTPLCNKKLLRYGYNVMTIRYG